MSSTRKSRLTGWLMRARSDLDRAAEEIEMLPDLDDHSDLEVSREVEEVRARVDALESRVSAIEGTRPR
jgi:hypothetical protein